MAGTHNQRRVAVIGAGISGVVSAGHLLAAGLDVTVFERNQAPGGVWLHDERRPLEPNYPSIKPSEADKTGKRGTEDEAKLALEHAPPGPCYDGLKNNVSTPLMRVKLNAWPEGTPDFVSHTVMQAYIQDTAEKSGVHDATIYGARVKNVSKEGETWLVTWSRLRENEETGVVEEVEQISTFDSVIVASGHYHAARVPDIAGLSEAKSKWPSRIIHSKGYRKPHEFKDKNILLIGGGVSSLDISREIGPVSKNVYQSTRNGEFDLSPNMLPENGVRISEVSHFEIQDEGRDLADGEPLPIVAHLKSGQRLCGLDGVIICTGYHITLPFLPGYHNDEISPANADDRILVTDGTQVHNLHKDIFYIPDPTLIFIGIPYYTATFTLFEFQAIVATAILSGIAQLPTEAEMRTEYNERVDRIGAGRKFHSLKDIEELYVADLLDWVNRYRESQGLSAIEGHTPIWHEAKAAQRERVRNLFQATAERRDSGIGELPVLEAMAPPAAATEERAVDASSDVIQKAPKRRWVSYIWDTFDKSPEERRLLFKLDTAILTFASLGYFIKYLDQININNAFVSGMKEDLSLYGNELNYMQTCWTVGYVIGEIPSNIILTRIRPRYWIPAMELLWTVLTFAMSRCNTATQFYVLRFFVGLAESTFYPGMQYIIGSWYRKDELAKRSCIFHTSSGIASMFSGYLMAAVYNLEGRGGFRGWQWLFIVDGIISLPVALSGFFVLPDVPEISNPWYLSKDEVALSQKRMQLEGRQSRQPYTKAKLKKIFTSWHIYVLTLLYMAFNNGGTGGQPVFQQYLKASKDPKYSVTQINAYPTTTSAVQAVNITCYISLAIWDIPEGWKWACFIMCGAGFGLSGLCMAWAHEICSDDNEERALVVGSMNEMAYVFQAWLPQVVWQQVDAPRYQKGFIAVTIISAIMIATALTTRTLHHREDAQKALQKRETDQEGEGDSSLASSPKVGPAEPEVPKL
ncbi:pantothenate transporter [Aspergillus steynii IBT 23096]|uniref:Pantothenate transporter n=1 Tax=Aspergillus steynii IBT 23096 TaxID=1392250 RepID=A0A2I2GMD7_9EURO|nr:pantothenate transporter [Aspergillus steynii IBT 23096]PLB54035.1 pantothenate transporter [Aspergillus steynii IBT 23096]